MEDPKLDWSKFKERNAQRIRIETKAEMVMAELKASLTMTAEVKGMYDRLNVANKALQDKWMALKDEAQEISFELYPFQVEAECKREEDAKAS